MKSLLTIGFVLGLVTLHGLALADDNPLTNLDGPIKLAPDANISQLSDEFGDEKSLEQWRQVFRDEQWTESQIERLDVNKTTSGCLALVPYTSGWYRDYRGILIFKPIEGDFVVTTHLRLTGRDGRSAPQRPFSLAGIMARSPRQITQQTWEPGGENYLFATMGATYNGGRYQFELKNTTRSDSKVHVADAPELGAEGSLQLARVGPHFLLLGRTAQGAWTLQQRFYRPDLPSTLQVGMTAYTDWPTVERLQPRDANTRRITEGQPDLLALFDYVRFARPNVPEALRSAALTDSQSVSNEQLLEFLGESANPAPTAK